jgi:hypothetical protein
VLVGAAHRSSSATLNDYDEPLLVLHGSITRAADDE